MYFTSYNNLIKLAEALEVNLKDLFDFPQKELSRKEYIDNILILLNRFEISNLKAIYNLLKNIERFK